MSEEQPFIPISKVYDPLTTIIREWRFRMAVSAIMAKSASRVKAPTNDAIAVRCGVSRGLVCLWYTGRSRPTLLDLAVIAEMHGCTDQELAQAHGAHFEAETARRASAQARRVRCERREERKR